METVKTAYVVGGSDQDGWVVWAELWVGRSLISNQVMGYFPTEAEARVHREGLETEYREAGEQISADVDVTRHPASEPEINFDINEPAYLCPNCGAMLTWGDDIMGSCPSCNYVLPQWSDDENDAGSQSG
jgi:hypothetical protein